MPFIQALLSFTRFLSVPSEMFNIIDSPDFDFFIDQVTPLFCRVI
jgi:hypothetical protein